MSSSKFKLDRRTLLKGMLGSGVVTVGLPPLELFFNSTGTAYAYGGGLPKRFGVYMWGNGVLPDRWNPPKQGAGDEWELSDQLAPLAAFKDRLAVVSGMHVKVKNEIPHGSGPGGVLSGAAVIRKGAGEEYTFALPSIDQVIAQEIGDDSRFRSLEFGVEPGAGLSFNGPDSRNPPESSPHKLFERLFGAGFAAPGDEPIVDPTVGLKLSVLDAVLGDAKRLKSRLGAGDKARLDRHMDGIRDLERRLEKLLEDPPDLAACAKPETPDEDYPDIEGRPQLEVKNKAFCDVLAMALACDQTRVFSNFLTAPVSNTLFPGASGGHHRLTHDEDAPQLEVHAIVLQCMERFADLLASLDAVDEGEGTLLDNSVILATSDVALGNTHTLEDYPIVLAGSACGALKTDVHYRAPSADNASKVMLSVVRAMDIAAPHFGDGEGKAVDGLGAIEA